MKARCKFKCESLTDHGNGYKSVVLNAVMGGSDENKSFHAATPTGKLEFSWMNQNVIFVPGKEYYLDIAEAAAILPEASA